MKVRYFRDQGRPIVYLDESYIHSSHTSSKAWHDSSSFGLFSKVSKGKRLVMVHAGSSAGFVKNSLLIFKSGCKTGDYHDDMNSTNYEQWLKDYLIPNLPSNSVIMLLTIIYK
nr:unnamed protein product [Callosobruchus analis]